MNSKFKILNFIVGLPLGIVLFVVLNIIYIPVIISNVRLLHEVMDSKDWCFAAVNVFLSLSFLTYFFKQAKHGLKDFSFVETVLLPFVVLFFYGFSFLPIQDKYETEARICLLEEKVYEAVSPKCSKMMRSSFFIKAKQSWDQDENKKIKQ